MTDDTKKNKIPEVAKVELPNSLEEVQKLLIDEKLKAVKPKNTRTELNSGANINNVEKKNNLTSKEAEKTSQDLAGLKADTHLSEAEKTVTAKKPSQVPAEKTNKEDKSKEEKGILDQAKDFVVDENNKPKWMNIGIVAAGTAIAYKAVSWIKSWFSDDKKEGESKSEDKPWYKNTWFWTGAVAVGGWLARDKWGREAANSAINSLTIKAKIAGVGKVPFVGDDAEKFLDKVLEEHKSEIDAVPAKEMEKKFVELAKKDNEKNGTILKNCVNLALYTLFDAPKSETEKTEEAKTEENKQKAEEVANETDQTTIQINSGEKKFDQKEFENRWGSINSQWNNLKDGDFEKNKQAILNIYTTALTTFEAFSSQKKISGNNITFSYPTIVSNMMDKIFEMTEFMKDKKEYVAAANGFRSMLNAGGDSIKPMPTPDISTIGLNDTDRKKLTDQLQKAKTQEEITKIIYGYIHSPNYQEKYNKQVMNWYNGVKNHIGYIEEKHINKTSNAPEFSKKLEKIVDLGNDLNGKGWMNIEDEFVDKYGSAAAGIGSMAAGMAVAIVSVPLIPLGGTGVAGEVAAGALISGGVAAVSRSLIENNLLGNNYELLSRDGASDFLINAIPGGMAVKGFRELAIFANTARVLGVQAGTALLYSADAIGSISSGVSSGLLRTGEAHFGMNLAFAALPFVMGKMFGGLGAIGVATSSKLSPAMEGIKNIIAKHVPKSTEWMLKLEKNRIIAAVNKSPLPAEVRKDLVDNADNISKEMQQEIGTYITQLESQGKIVEAAEVKKILEIAGVKQIRFSKAVKTATKEAAEALSPNVSALNSQIEKMSADEIKAFNEYMKKQSANIFNRKTQGFINHNGEKYTLVIDEGTKKLTFISQKGVKIENGTSTYNKIFNKFETSVQVKIINKVKEYAEQNGDQTLYEWMQQNGYQVKKGIDTKILMYLKDNKIGNIIRNCKLASDGKISWLDAGFTSLIPRFNNGIGSSLPVSIPWVGSLLKYGTSSGIMTIGSIVAAEGVPDGLQNGFMNLLLSNSPYIQLISNYLDYKDKFLPNKPTE